MPPRKRPRVNSLIRPQDRGGYKPPAERKPAVKWCAGMHRQAHDWRPEKGCKACKLIEIEREMSAERGARAKAAWEAVHGGAKTLEIRVVSTGRIKRYLIPGHLAKPKPSRGRRRRRRI